MTMLMIIMIMITIIGIQGKPTCHKCLNQLSGALHGSPYKCIDVLLIKKINRLLAHATGNHVSNSEAGYPTGVKPRHMFRRRHFLHTGDLPVDDIHDGKSLTMAKMGTQNPLLQGNSNTLLHFLNY